MIFKKGDSVRVKEGVKEPDTEEFELGGLQGRIISTAEEEEENLITIEWDSISLQQLPNDYIIQAEEDGLSWDSMVLFESDVEITVPRDKKRDVEKKLNELSDKFLWSSEGEESLRISKILEGVNLKDEMKCYQKWYDHLEKELSFPIQAVIQEYAENDWTIKSGEKVIIKSLSSITDMYALIADITFKGRKIEYPLCDLEVKNKISNDYQLIKDYSIWFSNR